MSLLFLALLLTFEFSVGILYQKSTTKSLKLNAIKGQLPDLRQASFPESPAEGYDLIVIGSGPGGESVAVHAAKLGARVAVIEKKSQFGGPTGLTSKAVREATKRICAAVDQIGGDRRRQVGSLWKRKFPALKSEAEVLQAKESRDKLSSYNIDLYIGKAEMVPPSMKTETCGDEGEDESDSERVTDASLRRMASSTRSLRSEDKPTRSTADVEETHKRDKQQPVTVQVSRTNTNCVKIHAKNVCIATGSRSNVPIHLPMGVPIPFTKGLVIDCTQVSSMNELPRSVAIIGGGVIAVEYATVLAELGVGVTLICPERAFLPFLDEDLRLSLMRTMRKNHVLIVHERVKKIKIDKAEAEVGATQLGAASTKEKKEEMRKRQVGAVKVTLEADPARYRAGRPQIERRFSVDVLLYSGGRDANSENIGCDNLELTIGKYGRISVDGSFHALQEGTGDESDYSVFAIGDVIGPPGLASAAQQQGRFVAEQLFDQSRPKFPVNKPLPSSSTPPEEDEDDEFTSDADPFFMVQTKTDSGSSNANTKPPTLLFGSDSGTADKAVIDAPLTLWTIPEIASVGLTLKQAAGRTIAEDGTYVDRHRVINERLLPAAQRMKKDTTNSIQTVEYDPKEVYIVQGFAYFKDCARGRLSGVTNKDGFLKVIAKCEPGAGVVPAKCTIVGVHIMGEGANELIQLGSILLHSNTELTTVSNTPFSAVTLSALYQAACDNALSHLKTK